ncbi:hypothetical protein KY330_00565 [Candidatus Woesearchaeota archaeon]|nr:hypothetical protein [Candidatus Woesearchaeota archaeon]
MDIILAIRDMNFTLSDAINGVSESDYEFYTCKQRDDIELLKGGLGELVGAYVIEQLLQEFPIKVYNEYYRSGVVELKPRHGLDALRIKDKRSDEKCEVDNLFSYKGRAYILESKVGLSLLLQSYERQIELVKRLLGMKPYMIELRLCRRNAVHQQMDDWYTVFFPLKEQIEEEARELLKTFREKYVVRKKVKRKKGRRRKNERFRGNNTFFN